jgi:hypothetical protein
MAVAVIQGKGFGRVSLETFQYLPQATSMDLVDELLEARHRATAIEVRGATRC